MKKASDYYHLIFKDVKGVQIKDTEYFSHYNKQIPWPVSVPKGTVKLFGLMGDDGGSDVLRFPDKTYHISTYHSDWYESENPEEILVESVDAEKPQICGPLSLLRGLIENDDSLWYYSNIISESWSIQEDEAFHNKVITEFTYLLDELPKDED